MGGCLSKKGLSTGRHHTGNNNKGKKPRSSKKKKKKKKQSQHLAADRGGPVLPLPPSPPEEEAVVKEVLTEIPTSSVFAAPAVPNSSCCRAENDNVVIKPLPYKVNATTSSSSVSDCRYNLGGRFEGAEGTPSEIYSASESFSVSTTLTEKRDTSGGEDLEEQTSALRKRPSTKTRHRPHERSPNASSWKSYHHQRTRSSSAAGDVPSRRELLKCGLAGGKSSPSQLKRPLEGRFFPSKDTACSTARQRAESRNAAVDGDQARRERGERSGRGRSASPAAKRVSAGGGGGIRGVANRNTPMRRKAWRGGRASPEQMPRRVEEDSQQQMTMMIMAKGGGGGGAEEKQGGEGVRTPATVPEEMLENPLVAMECFIFL